MKAIIILTFACFLCIGTSYAEPPRADMEKRVIELEKRVKLLEYKEEVRAMLEKIESDGAPLKKYFEDAQKNTIQYLLKSNGELIDRVMKLENNR